MNDKEIESEIIAKGLTAARVTPDDIEANITSEHYFTAADGVGRANKGTTSNFGKNPAGLELVTICVLLLRNGHKIVGVNEGPVSADNFDAELGKKLARNKSTDQIWPLMGYALKERLSA